MNRPALQRTACCARHLRIRGMAFVMAFCLLAPVVSGADRSLSRLVGDLSGKDAVARFTAEEQLVKMGDKAVAALKPLATSPGFTPARQYAIIVVARIGNEKAVRLLLDILEKEQDVKVRALACKHLGRLGVEEAVPLVGKWLFGIKGKNFKGAYPGYPASPTLAWLEHVYALREIGSEKGIPILEKMAAARHGGPGGRQLMKAYRNNLNELKKEARFWKAVRRTRGLEKHVKLLFAFFRKDTLALIRLHRVKVVSGGREGRWVLEDMKTHSDANLRKAAAALLENYGKLQP